MSGQERDLLKQPPEKVLFMYRAVNDMINEGCDISNMKVADITKRAGIGKGTAYEYFSSKEEIIMKALVFEMMSCFDAVREITYRNQTFRETVFELMDFGAEHFYEGRTWLQLLKIILGAFDVPESLQAEFRRMQEQNICNQFVSIKDAIMEVGRKEGIVKQSDPTLQKIVFHSQIITFTMMLHEISKEGNSEEKLKRLKEYTYECFVKMLG